MRVLHHPLYFQCTRTSCRKSALRDVTKGTAAPPRIETTVPAFLAPPLDTIYSSFFEKQPFMQKFLKEALCMYLCIIAHAKFLHWTTRWKKWIQCRILKEDTNIASLSRKSSTIFCAIYIQLCVQSLVSSSHRNQWRLTYVDRAEGRVQSLCCCKNKKTRQCH